MQEAEKPGREAGWLAGWRQFHMRGLLWKCDALLFSLAVRLVKIPSISRCSERVQLSVDQLDLKSSVKVLLPQNIPAYICFGRFRKEM